MSVVTFTSSQSDIHHHHHHHQWSSYSNISRIFLSRLCFSNKTQQTLVTLLYALFYETSSFFTIASLKSSSFLTLSRAVSGLYRLLTRRLNCLTPVRTNGGLGLFILSKLKHKVKLTEKRKVGFVPPYKHAAAVAAERFFKSNICFLYWKYIRHNRKKERARQLKFGNNISNVPHFHSGSKYGKVLKERDSLMLGHKKE